MNRKPKLSSLLVLLLAASSCASFTTAQETVDCSKYQSTHLFDGMPLTLHYTVTSDGILSTQVAYEGLGYVGWGISPDGRMTGSVAVIGQPGADANTSSVEKYQLSGYSTSTVTALDTTQQTLLSSSIVQNETHTVLEFSKLLKEANAQELEIVADGVTTNYFLVAAGAQNALGFHRYRAAVGLPLAVCQEGALVSDSSAPAAVQVEAVDNKQSLFRAHGILSAIAWGFLAPLAISSSLCRHLIPKAGLWFQIHFYANILVLLLTVIAFALAVRAIQATEGGNHFQPGHGPLEKHKTIGLVVFIVVVLQAMGGIMRPHPAEQNQKTTIRTLWEFVHKGSGITLLAMGLYQCHSGMVLYFERFQILNDSPYITAFWAVAGILAGLGILGKMHNLFVYQEPQQPPVQSDHTAKDATASENKQLPESAKNESA